MQPTSNGDLYSLVTTRQSTIHVRDMCLDSAFIPGTLLQGGLLVQKVHILCLLVLFQFIIQPKK